MFKIINEFRIKMWYNDGNTEINKTTLFFSGAEFIAEEYSKKETIDYKYYIIYCDITVKLFGIVLAKSSIKIKEWGQYDEF